MNHIDWIIQTDPSLDYLVHRHLFKIDDAALALKRKKILEEGIGKRLMDLRQENGLWGGGVYSPKWISLHYTLKLLLEIGADLSAPPLKESAQILLDSMWYLPQGKKRKKYLDTCVAGMILNMSLHAKLDSHKIKEIIDYLILCHMDDGGWNCQWDKAAIHSSLHTTICVLEAILAMEEMNETYRLDELRKYRIEAIEFILKKKLFRSVRTNEVIDEKMKIMSFPTHWQYDLYRALYHFALIHLPFDSRMEEALQCLLKKQNSDLSWPLQAARRNFEHFPLETKKKKSAFNTFRALVILNEYGKNVFQD